MIANVYIRSGLWVKYNRMIESVGPDIIPYTYIVVFHWYYEGCTCARVRVRGTPTLINVMFTPLPWIMVDFPPFFVQMQPCIYSYDHDIYRSTIIYAISMTHIATILPYIWTSFTDSWPLSHTIHITNFHHKIAVHERPNGCIYIAKIYRIIKTYAL